MWLKNYSGVHEVSLASATFHAVIGARLKSLIIKSLIIKSQVMRVKIENLV